MYTYYTFFQNIVLNVSKQIMMEQLSICSITHKERISSVYMHVRLFGVYYLIRCIRYYPKNFNYHSPYIIMY